jgi:hypothetical protein
VTPIAQYYEFVLRQQLKVIGKGIDMQQVKFLSYALLASVLASPFTATAVSAGPSVYLSAPNDAQAITVQAQGDGQADDTAAIQAAIDAAEHKGAGGIVFLPSGRYRLSKTLTLWPGVRLFGVGATRPVLLLAPNTPGFQQGVANMVIFTGRGPGATFKVPFPVPGSVPFREDIADANSGTFYTAMGNIDIEIGDGNPAAAAIRFHAAQHAFLRHMDFRLGSAFAGIYQAGNEAEDVHFYGGRYGIVTEKPSAAWQFTLLDATFDGQRDAAIREHEAGLTLVNVAISNTKVGIEIDAGYSDWLWAKDVRFSNVSQAGVVISNENNVYTQIGFENALASNTPTFARFRESGKTLEQAAPNYQVTEFTYGLTVPSLGKTGEFATRFNSTALATVPAPRAAAIRAFPPTSEWVNVQTLGAKGDGKADDTAALQAAINTARVLYFPSGFYKLTDTLVLKPNSVLLGLHPSTTQLVVPDETPAFQGIGAPKAMIEAPKGGDNIVSGLGVFASGINARATNLLWQAGENSLVDDVKILGGHGTQLQDGSRFNPYDAMHAADADPRKRWDAQYPSLWVTNGGGGTFSNIWTANTYAQSGFTVSDTTTSGHVYEISNEHHGRAEFVLNRVENWEFLAPQTEEEVGESQDALSFDIRNSHNILLANYHGYRVTRGVKPALTAVRLENSDNIRFRNVHVNAESGLATCDANGCGTYLRASKFPYENAIVDVTRGGQVREREFAVLDIPATVKKPAASKEQVTKLAGDFFSIAGAATDATGKLYFIDRKFQRIYTWSEQQGLTVERDATLDPINLAIDASGNVLVLSSYGAEGTVYSFKPGSPETELTLIAPTATASHTNASTLLPGNHWNNGEFKDQYDPATDHFTTLAELFARDVAMPKPREYVSLDGSLVLPAYRVFQQGPPTHMGWRWSDSLQAYSLIKAKADERVYLSNESEGKVYAGVVGNAGAVTDLKVFANRGGESVVVDSKGKVYVANGQIFVYDASGKQLEQIEVPERPLQLVIGGSANKTLFILTHHALYSYRLR